MLWGYVAWIGVSAWVFSVMLEDRRFVEQMRHMIYHDKETAAMPVWLKYLVSTVVITASVLLWPVLLVLR